MPATFLILFAGGLLLAVAVSDRQRTESRLPRRAGLLSLATCAAACLFYSYRAEVADTPLFFRRIQAGLVIATFLSIAGFVVAYVAGDRWRLRRVVAVAAFLVSVLAGSNLLHDTMLVRGTAMAFPPKALSIGLQTLASAGVAAIAGLAVARVLVPEVTADARVAVTVSRLGPALAAAFGYRAIVAVCLVLILQGWRPFSALWSAYGAAIAARWGFGLLLPGALFYFIARRGAAGTGAAGTAPIKSVGAGLVLAGEWLALDLVRRTGLPF